MAKVSNHENGKKISWTSEFLSRQLNNIESETRFGRRLFSGLLKIQEFQGGWKEFMELRAISSYIKSLFSAREISK